MTTSIEPLNGPRRFQWNSGGWFGSSLGSSGWMMLASCFLLVHNQPTLAIVSAIGFATVLLTSLILWRLRDRIYPFTALMALLGLLAIEMPIIFFVISTFGSDAALAAMNWPESTWPMVLGCAVVPILMLWFLFLERSTTPNSRPTTNATNRA